MGWITVHVATSSTPRKVELGTIGAVTAMGLLFDQPQAIGGVQSFDPDHARIGSVPVWIAVLWAAFAATFHTSFSWLQGRYVLASVFGAIFGPLAYLGGESLGALQIGIQSRELGLVALSLEWALALPLGLWIAETVRQRASEPPSSANSQASSYDWPDSPDEGQ